jgi:heme/copper-type cytochrome/quinol oxidase subunit 3
VGALGFVVLEGTGFALAIALSLYLYATDPHWLRHTAPLTLWPGTALTALLVLSVIPNLWTSAVARKEDLGRTRIAMVVMSLIAVATLPLRAYEFALLPVKWDANAYGSAVWFLLDCIRPISSRISATRLSSPSSCSPGTGTEGASAT